MRVIDVVSATVAAAVIAASESHLLVLTCHHDSCHCYCLCISPADAVVVLMVLVLTGQTVITPNAEFRPIMDLPNSI